MVVLERSMGFPVATSSSKRTNRVKTIGRVKTIAKKKNVAAAASFKAKHASAKPAGKKNATAKGRSPKKIAPARKPAPVTKPLPSKVAAAKGKPVNKAPINKAPVNKAVAPPRKPLKDTKEKSRPVPAPPPAAAPSLKPKKNPAGLGLRDLQFFTEQLLAKRRELVGDMSSMEREALRSGSGSNLSTLPMHMADMGTDNFEQEFTLGLVEKDRNLLREINHALSKIQNGTYGICEGTGLPIAKARLEAAPWARYGIEYARQREKNGMGVRTL
jgi:RNA polymerase-binding transcription factor DksA